MQLKNTSKTIQWKKAKKLWRYRRKVSKTLLKVLVLCVSPNFRYSSKCFAEIYRVWKWKHSMKTCQILLTDRLKDSTFRLFRVANNLTISFFDVKLQITLLFQLCCYCYWLLLLQSVTSISYQRQIIHLTYDLLLWCPRPLFHTHLNHIKRELLSE